MNQKLGYKWKIVHFLYFSYLPKYKELFAKATDFNQEVWLWACQKFPGSPTFSVGKAQPAHVTLPSHPIPSLLPPAVQLYSTRYSNKCGCTPHLKMKSESKRICNNIVLEEQKLLLVSSVAFLAGDVWIALKDVTVPWRNYKWVKFTENPVTN